MATNFIQSLRAWPFAMWLCCSYHRDGVCFSLSHSCLAWKLALTNRMQLKWCLSSGLRPKVSYKFSPFLLLALKPPCEGASWEWEPTRRKRSCWQPEQHMCSEAIYESYSHSPSAKGVSSMVHPRPAEAPPSCVQPKLLTPKTVSKQSGCCFKPLSSGVIYCTIDNCYRRGTQWLRNRNEERYSFTFL